MLIATTTTTTIRHQADMRLYPKRASARQWYTGSQADDLLDV